MKMNNANAGWKRALLLVLIASVLPEVLSGNTSILFFVKPKILLLLFIGYGLPVLIIRDIAARWTLGIGGIMALGIAYGIYNEGLFGKTMIAEDHVPIPAFDHYGMFLGVGVPWSATICLWHSLASVLFPVVMTYSVYDPGKDQKPWLNKWLSGGLGVLLVLFGCINFLGGKGKAGSPLQLLSLLLIMLGCALWARFRPGTLLRSEICNDEIAKPILAGISTLLFSAALFYIAAKKMPVFVFFGVFAVGLWLYRRMMKACGWLTIRSLFWFGIGFYIQMTLLTLASHLH